MHGNRYFCFTVYTDNEQEEEGDTYIHTFIKHDWPDCQTRYFYFVGERFGLPSPSTSPVFEKHFSQAEAPPPPEHMDELVSIEPQYRVFQAGVTWLELDLTHEIHPDATGIIFCVINSDIGASRYLGLRAKGSAHTWASPLKRHTHTWGLCPVSTDLKIEYYPSYLGTVNMWIMGYTGRNVHYLEPPVDITPGVELAWTPTDLSTHAPNAKAVILDAGKGTTLFPAFGARCTGSTDNRIQGCGHVFPVIKCSATQSIDLYVHNHSPANAKVWLLGYITDNVTMETNGINLQAGPNATWNLHIVTASYPTPKFAFIEWAAPGVTADFGARKRHSLRDIRYDGDAHNWAIVHCNHTGHIEMWREVVVDGQFLQGVSH